MNPEAENIAQTLTRELPQAKLLHTEIVPAGGQVLHLIVPKHSEHRAIDTESLLANPRRIKTKATLGDDASFVEYVNRHKGPSTVIWCTFDPQTFKLKFDAVIDEHDDNATSTSSARPGWRAHTASFEPGMSSEWKVWAKQNKAVQEQVAFAEFLEANEPDFAAVDGMPTSLQMHEMATNFAANADRRIKSGVRLQSGGVSLEYVDTDNDETIEKMKLFERFAIGIPVFWTLPAHDNPITAYRIDARLKYRIGNGKVTFFYDLIRPDLVHQKAAIELIARIAAGTDGVPMLQGSAT